MNPLELTTESTIYVTYLASTPEKVWQALTVPEFTAQYFFGRRVESNWQLHSTWLLRKPDGEVDVEGIVRESVPPQRLVVSWNVASAKTDQSFPECIVTYEVESIATGVVRLTMSEAHPTPIPVAWLEGGRRGWPMILSGLKTLLETGTPLPLPSPAPAA